MIPQRTGPQLDLASGNLKALVVQAGAVSAVTHWLPSASAVFCRMCLLTRSHISRHSPQHESSMFNPLSGTKTSLSASLPCPTSPLSLSCGAHGWGEQLFPASVISCCLCGGTWNPRWRAGPRSADCRRSCADACGCSLPVLRTCSRGSGERRGGRGATAPHPCLDGREEHPAHGDTGDGELSWMAG